MGNVCQGSSQRPGHTSLGRSLVRDWWGPGPDEGLHGYLCADGRGLDHVGRDFDGEGTFVL